MQRIQELQLSSSVLSAFDQHEIRLCSGLRRDELQIFRLQAISSAGLTDIYDAGRTVDHIKISPVGKEPGRFFDKVAQRSGSLVTSRGQAVLTVDHAGPRRRVRRIGDDTIETARRKMGRYV